MWQAEKFGLLPGWLVARCHGFPGGLKVVSGWRTTPASGAQGRVKHQEKWGRWGQELGGASHCSTHLYLVCMSNHNVFIVLIMGCRLGCLGVSCN